MTASRARNERTESPPGSSLHPGLGPQCEPGCEPRPVRTCADGFQGWKLETLETPLSVRTCMRARLVHTGRGARPQRAKAWMPRVDTGNRPHSPGLSSPPENACRWKPTPRGARGRAAKTWTTAGPFERRQQRRIPRRKLVASVHAIARWRWQPKEMHHVYSSQAARISRLPCLRRWSCRRRRKFRRVPRSARFWRGCAGPRSQVSAVRR